MSELTIVLSPFFSSNYLLFFFQFIYCNYNMVNIHDRYNTVTIDSYTRYVVLFNHIYLKIDYSLDFWISSYNSTFKPAFILSSGDSEVSFFSPLVTP